MECIFTPTRGAYIQAGLWKKIINCEPVIYIYDCQVSRLRETQKMASKSIGWELIYVWLIKYRGALPHNPHLFLHTIRGTKKTICHDWTERKGILHAGKAKTSLKNFYRQTA